MHAIEGNSSKKRNSGESSADEAILEWDNALLWVCPTEEQYIKSLGPGEGRLFLSGAFDEATAQMIKEWRPAAEKKARVEHERYDVTRSRRERRGFLPEVAREVQALLGPAPVKWVTGRRSSDISAHLLYDDLTVNVSSKRGRQMWVAPLMPNYLTQTIKVQTHSHLTDRFDRADWTGRLAVGLDQALKHLFPFTEKQREGVEEAVRRTSFPAQYSWIRGERRLTSLQVEGREVRLYELAESPRSLGRWSGPNQEVLLYGETLLGSGRPEYLGALQTTLHELGHAAHNHSADLSEGDERPTRQSWKHELEATAFVMEHCTDEEYPLFQKWSRSNLANRKYSEAPF